MTRLATFFLILLRLAIGWHFLVEGFQKIPAEQLTALGLPTNNKPFSSAGYFRESPGPFAKWIRDYEGDPDQFALDRLTLEPAPVTQKDAKERLPRGLRQDWETYLKQFSDHYKLDESQKKKAQELLDKAAAEVVRLLNYVPDPDPTKRDVKLHEKSVTTQTRTFPKGEVKREMTLSERIEEYKKKLQELEDTTKRKLWVFGKDVEGTRLREQKAEVAALRNSLLADLDKQTEAFKESLLVTVLSDSQAKQTRLEPEKKRTIIYYLDLVTPWMLAGVGASLFLGLFARLGAFLGAGFLLMTYLAAPSWPWLPSVGPTEGNYLFVNKNLIEMLALCVLMSLPTGRWFGVDAILNVFGRLFFGEKPQVTASITD